MYVLTSIPNKLNICPDDYRVVVKMFIIFAHLCNLGLYLEVNQHRFCFHKMITPTFGRLFFLVNCIKINLILIDFLGESTNVDQAFAKFCTALNPFLSFCAVDY